MIYESWLSSNMPDGDPIGTEDGDICGRYAEPDEDAPRRYRPKPCQGEMVDDGHGFIRCDCCGELVP